MPTIEIVSVNANLVGLNQNDYDVAIREEFELISHRNHYWEWLSTQKGTIIHIGNPEFKFDTEGFFFAGLIIDWDFEPGMIEIPNFDEGETGANQQFNFKFLEDYQIDVVLILKMCLERSPKKEAYFMTGYQFGPEEEQMLDIKLDDFWKLYDTSGLRWNTLYKIKK